MNHFHNTIHLQDQDLSLAELKSQAQDTCILNFLKAHSGVRYTARQVWQVFKDYELTSVRRALTNLTKRGDIVHHDKDYRMESKGKPNTTYSYIKTGLQLTII